ncbi:hypothetical protein SAMN04489835_1189 [Mycolicibacterium rutilum]|uniref:Uncharacterized protein n=2 Tax=Mycolicibacterium rutilum TaxID=370526 RepID=A0A1H6IWN9_MYCRU|nr:hypothetical protein SAMN04489835_1189 [Mycolicibacterium rutilum]
MEVSGLDTGAVSRKSYLIDRRSHTRRPDDDHPIPGLLMMMVECRREIDVPSGHMSTVVDKLCELSESERRAAKHRLRPGTALDYTASLRVFDVAATGRVLAVWIGTLHVSSLDDATLLAYRDAAFADFVDQMRREWPVLAEQAS